MKHKKHLNRGDFADRKQSIDKTALVQQASTEAILKKALNKRRKNNAL